MTILTEYNFRFVEYYISTAVRNSYRSLYNMHTAAFGDKIPFHMFLYIMHYKYTIL